MLKVMASGWRAGFLHALAPVAALLVREVISGMRIMTDLTLGLEEVVHDYLKQG